MPTKNDRKRNGSRGNGSRSSGSRSRARRADALRLLKEDHANVKDLFQQFEKAQSREKQEIASQICAELTQHAQLEEQHFYPVVRGAIDEESLVEEARVEHDSIKQLIAQIEGSRSADAHFEALVTVLREYVMHHVKEEEGEMFPAVRDSDLDLEALGEELMAAKGEEGEPGARD
jgi:hemerythrin superfamily protein